MVLSERLIIADILFMKINTTTTDPTVLISGVLQIEQGPAFLTSAKGWGIGSPKDRTAHYNEPIGLATSPSSGLQSSPSAGGEEE